MGKAYPSLDTHLTTDIAIIGAGISGALTAYYLRNSGYSVVVVDKRHAGMGSTAASTSFLQYEIDTPMIDLAKYAGEENAVQSYELCRKAIYDIAAICKKLKPQFDFHLRPSLQYASYKKDKEELYEEYKMRKKYDFDVRWLEPEYIREHFRLDSPAAILSKDAAEVDAYLLTHALLGTFFKAGHKVYNNTGITDIEYHKRYIKLTTGTGFTIKAKKLIIACGYESQKYIPKKIADVYATYAVVTEPVNKEVLWYRSSLIWETAFPYLYFRIVTGNRILIGGKDDLFHDPDVRDGRIKRKTDMLIQAFSKKMDIPVKPDFSWAGAFAVTKDGLPYIGTIPERKNTYFALGFGGNGITFSAIAAEIICDELLGIKNENAALFSFNR
ncbi:MAG: FAD-binding oxidoreductase [Flavipsychrobacter sp.]|nr:FAD-binding oxidoreductase [Flavipsychrobacter sp.]